jgi:CDGSH-type Zn-finger protein
MFFSAAKNAQTRFDRIEKFKNQIMDGKGINDCTCGLSQKMPACDGSHKILRVK